MKTKTNKNKNEYEQKQKKKTTKITENIHNLQQRQPKNEIARHGTQHTQNVTLTKRTIITIM